MRVDALLKESMEALEFLESDPVSTDDYVEYIKFVDRAQQKVDNMEAQLDYVKELYDIMEEYQIFVPPEDMSNYLVIVLYIFSIHLSIQWASQFTTIRFTVTVLGN